MGPEQILAAVRGLDDVAWAGVWPGLLAESARRESLARAADEVRRLATDYLAARDVGHDGAWPAWVQPTGAHDSYPVGYQVTHGGRVWRSVSSVNTAEPGTDPGSQGAWEDVTTSPDPAEPTGPAPTAPPAVDVGAGPEPYTPPPAPAVGPWEPGVPYYEGDMVAWQDTTWRVTTEHESTDDAPPHEAPGLYEPA